MCMTCECQMKSEGKEVGGEGETHQKERCFIYYVLVLFAHNTLYM